MAKGDDIEERLIEFAVIIIRLCEVILKTVAEVRTMGRGDENFATNLHFHPPYHMIQPGIDGC